MIAVVSELKGSGRAAWGACLVLVAALLAACSNGQDEIAAWMAQQRATVQPKVEPVQGPQAHVPQAYLGAAGVSPFNEANLTVLLQAQADAPAVSGLLAAELQRRQEPLEAVPLDTLTMVGLLRRGNEWVALVRSGQLIHQVRRGNHMGQNYGRITAISETQITLREIAQDPTGAWVERSTTLYLQEGVAR